MNALRGEASIPIAGRERVLRPTLRQSRIPSRLAAAPSSNRLKAGRIGPQSGERPVRAAARRIPTSDRSEVFEHEETPEMGERFPNTKCCKDPCTLGGPGV